MYKENPVQEKSFAFAVRIVKMYRFISEERHEVVLSKQILRSGTSIGANIRESKNAQSKLDYINKLSIALKEADETAYWLDLFKETELIDTKQYESMSKDCIELIKLLTSIIKTTKLNMDRM